MRQDWISFARATVPRYTSYPTAVQFNDGIGARQVGDWAATVDPHGAISVYVHVPFCEQLCWYCGCHTSVPNGYARVERYVDQLHREIDLWARQVGAHDGVKHLHFGGGSPNALSASDFVAVVNRIEAAFTLRSDAEIAVELDPRSLTPERIAALAISGVTRASLGVQTLSRPVQEAINRVQPREMIEESVESLRKAGIAAINMDLMYGLPHQRVEDVVEAARFAAGMGTDRVAVFGYAHVPWFAKHQRAINAEALPGLGERFHQAEAVGATLSAAGYAAIGLDHFARPGDEMAVAAKAGALHRNFQGYTTDPCDTLIGLGVSSISAFRQGFAQNTKDRRAWEAAIAEGRLPTERGVTLTDDDRLRGRAIEALMCNLTVDTAAICREKSVAEDALDGAIERARPLEAAGLCEIEGRCITVPEEARALMRTVARCFDAYVPAEDAAPRHARAV
ncbi:oxygen-independent coproporphyrinogen III oxidase [Henriciella sp.]|uniref:oxygen-independent coproporphyrinogen III oxidase n=1 Tax=Henriciella sp. TaxID=1968823 RepID=UPI002620A00F|nr:oxygen-independent coproporphyrinogen III oxidase [Henriciella sp.]